MQRSESMGYSRKSTGLRCMYSGQLSTCARDFDAWSSFIKKKKRRRSSLDWYPAANFRQVILAWYGIFLIWFHLNIIVYHWESQEGTHLCSQANQDRRSYGVHNTSWAVIIFIYNTTIAHVGHGLPYCVIQEHVKWQWYSWNVLRNARV